MPRTFGHDSHSNETSLRPIHALVVLATAFLAYWPVLSQFFLPIDDPLLLWSVSQGHDPTPRFRPLYAVWNGWLLGLFGERPLGWYASGLVVHAANSLLVGFLCGWVTRRARAVLVGSVVFAALYSPNEAVCWIAANCGLLCVCFLLVGGALWTRYLDASPERKRRWVPYTGANVALALSMGFKEDCVLAGALFVGLDLCRNGWRALVRPRRLLAYALPALLAAFYLSVAYRPEVWSESPGAGRYVLGWESLPKLFQNFAVLFWPRATYLSGTSPVLAAIGLAVALAVLALPRPRANRLVRFGCALAIFGLLPVLPGPFPIAGTRYAYPAAIGAAMVLTGAVEAVWGSVRKPSWRAALGLAGVAWLAVNLLSLRSVQQWRYRSAGDRLQRMISTSRAVLDVRPAIVAGPQVLNVHDYFLALCVWSDVPRGSIRWEAVPLDGSIQERLLDGGDLNPESLPVFACRENGEVFRLRAADPSVAAIWAESPSGTGRSSVGRALSVVRLEAVSSLEPR